MAISLSDNLNVATNAPVDVKYGPHVGSTESAAIAVANNAIASGVRFEGLTVGLIIGSSDIEEYWYQSGILDADLVEKSGGTEVIANPVLQPGTAEQCCHWWKERHKVGIFRRTYDCTTVQQKESIYVLLFKLFA